MKDSEKKANIRKHFIIVCILIVIAFVAAFYGIPRSFDQIVSLQEQNSITSMHVSGNLPNGMVGKEIPNEKVPEIMEVLNSHQYKRYIDGPIGGHGIFIDLMTESPRWSITIEVWKSGYIRIPNHEIYRVLENENGNLIDELNKLLM